MATLCRCWCSHLHNLSISKKAQEKKQAQPARFLPNLRSDSFKVGGEIAAAAKTRTHPERQKIDQHRSSIVEVQATSALVFPTTLDHNEVKRLQDHIEMCCPAPAQGVGDKSQKGEVKEIVLREVKQLRKKVGDHGHSQKSERLVRAEAVRAAVFGCSGVRAWRCCLDVLVRRNRMTMVSSAGDTSMSETCSASTS